MRESELAQNEMRITSSLLEFANSELDRVILKFFSISWLGCQHAYSSYDELMLSFWTASCYSKRLYPFHPRAFRFSKIPSDFCSRALKHLILCLSLHWKYQLLRLKTVCTQRSIYRVKMKFLKNSIVYNKIYHFAFRQFLVLRYEVSSSFF